MGADTLHKLSTPERDLFEDGYLAERPEDELPAPDLELNQLVSIEDVTERVTGAVKDEMTTGEAMTARRAVMAAIEKESLDATGLRSRCGHPLRRRSLSPLSLQEIHRRAPGLGARSGDRLLRRRRRQLRVPSLLPGRLDFPRL